MKLFLIAFACEPNRTSEPGVGWNIVGELAKRHELTVLTRCNNRKAIEAYIAADPAASHGRIHWEYYDLAEWFHRLKKKLPCGIQLYQELWQRGAAKAYGDEFKKYDIVHHLTFGSIFFTPWAAKYTDRFVWGPIGGASGAMEDAFLRNESIKSRISEIFYRLVAWYSFHPAPWAADLRRKCRVVLFRTTELASAAKLDPGQITAVIPETAYAGEIVPRQYNARRRPLKIMSVGRLIPLKGVKYTIQAFAAFLESGGEGELHVYGDGPLRHELESLATERYGFNAEPQSVRGNPAPLCRYVKKPQGDSMIIFHGNVPNSEILAALDSTDVLVHSSFREGGSWTILEAMAHGVPVICQDRAGMKDMVMDDCGLKISAENPDTLIEEATRYLMEYYMNRDLLRLHGVAVQKRVTSIYKWEIIAAKINEIYSCIMGNTNAG
ncbi:MAG: glycosyltransferase family 4 protein [Kiritimatiellia bacterium]